jgi:hypothetical protein
MGTQLARKLGEFTLWYVAEDEVPAAQVQLAVVWVDNYFYRNHSIPRDSFLEIIRHKDGKTKSIFRIVRCLNKGKVRRGSIGLQYDCLRALDFSVRPGDETVEVYSVHWVRGIFPYLARHPNPLIRYQFWLSSFLAVIGIFLGVIGLLG